jgi:hypothetical protein
MGIGGDREGMKGRGKYGVNFDENGKERNRIELRNRETSRKEG